MNVESIKKEFIDVGLITLYFFVCFAIFIVLKKLLLFEYNITFYGWATAVIGALLIGKVVFLIDKTPIHQWLEHLRPVKAIIAKALIYTVIVFSVSVLEKTIHFLLEANPTESWQASIFGGGKTALLAAHTTYIFFCFIGFYFLHFLNEAFGRKTILSLLFKLPGKEKD